MYADFKIMLYKVKKSCAKVLHEHKPLSVEYYSIDRYNDSKSYYRYYVSEDSDKWLMKQLKVIAKNVEKIRDQGKEMEPLTFEEEEKFQQAVKCHICEF